MKKTIILSIFFTLFTLWGLDTQAQCKADFQFSVKCNTVEFYDSSNIPRGSFAAIVWDFGDNSTGRSYYEKHTYSKTGTYTVKLYITAYDSSQKVVCRDTATKTITISKKCCKADFSYQVNGLDVYFWNNSQGGSKLTWDFGDSSSTNSYPHKYSKAGTYTVCLKIEDSSGTCKDSICKTITLKANNCKAKFSWSQPDTTKPVIKFTNLSTPSGLNYSWSFGDGTSSTAKDPTHTYTRNSIVTVCLTVYDSARSCSDRYCATITLKGTHCVADFNYSNAGNNIIYFHNKGTYSRNYKWTFGDGKSSTQFNPKHQYAKSGSYNVCLVVSDSANNCSDTLCKTIKVDSTTCDASFTVKLDTTTNKVTFTPAKTSPRTYHSWWSKNSTIGSSSTAFTHQFPRGGTITVCHYISKQDSSGFCSDTFCTTFTLPTNSACDGSFTYKITDTTKRIVKFTSNATGSNVKYSWIFGDGKTSTQQHPTHTYSSGGVYTVLLTVSVVDSNNRVICSDSTYKVVNLGSSQNCKAKFSVRADTTKKYKVWIINQSTGTNLQYYWTFGDGGSSTKKNPTHKYKNFGKYQVCLMVYDSNSCRSMYCDSIGMDSSGKLYKQEGFEIVVIDEGAQSTGKIIVDNSNLYPNPFQSSFTLDAGNEIEELANVQILDMKGQMMNFDLERINNQTVHIEAGNLPKGMYLIRYTLDDMLQTKRIVKVE